MACHLSHKLPWGQLLDVYVEYEAQGRIRRKICSPKVARFLQYFAQCFIQQLQEFRATDKSTVEEISDIDPKGWGDHEFTMGGSWMGYYDSLVWGYLELNLLLMDPKKVVPLLMPNGRLSWALSVIGEYSNGSHPNHIAGPLREALKGFLISFVDENHARPRCAAIPLHVQYHGQKQAGGKRDDRNARVCVFRLGPPIRPRKN